MSIDLINRLRNLDSSAVSDALDILHLKGVALGLHSMTIPGQIAGPVLTVQLDVAHGQQAEHHLGTGAIDAARLDDIIVVAHAGREYAAGWGGLLSLGAVKHGVAGVIVDGACRDIDEIHELGLPVFARTSVPVTARRRVVEAGWNVAVRVAGIDVIPGDYVIADGSGVVFLPAIRAAEIIQQAEYIMQRELAMSEAIRAGIPLAEVMGLPYEVLLNDKGDSINES